MLESIRKHRPQILRGGFFVAVVIALLISLTSLWLKRVFFTPNNLSNIVTTSLKAESSRDSISSLVVDRMFEGRPASQRIAGPRIEPIISGLLNTDIAGNALGSAVEMTRNLLTTRDREPIVIELGGVKDTIIQVQAVIGRSEEERRIDADKIPDQIVLLDTEKLPDIYTPSLVVLWLGPISLVFAIGGLSYWVCRGRSVALFKRLRIAGYLIFITSIIALLLGPLTEPVIVGYARKSEGQTLLGNMYSSLLAPFNHQATVLGIIAIVIIVLSVLLPLALSYGERTPEATVSAAKKRNSKKRN